MRLVGYYTGTPGESLTVNPAAPPPGSTGAAGTAPPPAVAVNVPTPAAPTLADLQAMRQQLAAASLRLHTVLDANWRTYLDLPGDVYAGDRPANAANLQQALGRFDGIARDPKYATLSQRVEFRATHEWLQRYVSACHGHCQYAQLGDVGRAAEVRRLCPLATTRQLQELTGAAERQDVDSRVWSAAQRPVMIRG